MSKANFLKSLAEQISANLPNHLGTLKKDIEKNCHSTLMQAFAKLELVTREEFDTQTKVLARTRKKLEALEAQLEKIEHRLKAKQKK